MSDREAKIREATTLLEMMRLRADHTPDKRAFCFQENDYTFANIWADVERMAAHFEALGVSARDRVVIVHPNGPEFFGAFYAAQRLSAIAVPIFPGSGPKRVAAYVEACGAKIISLPSFVDETQRQLITSLVEDKGVTVVGHHDAETDTPRQPRDPQPGDVAFLQYTSGSTGAPKGVRLTHQSLLTNMRQMIEGMEITVDDRFLSWLPVCHDMGLILKTLVPFYLGAELFLMESSIADPNPWLRAIEDNAATFTAAPDFAYRLAIRRSKDPRPDLSSLRVALNAAEPVRSETVSEFEMAFGLKNVMAPAYGLAEATVGVSMTKPGTSARVSERGIVAVGRPFPGVELQVWEDGAFAPPGKEGEILIRSKANCDGYFRDEEATGQLFRSDGFFHSGDAGFLDQDGFLYITGRLKNILIVGGRNIAPQEVEEAADAVTGVRFSAAVGIDRGGIEGEQIHLFAEIRQGEDLDQAELDKTTRSIVREIHARLALRPAQVHLLAPGAIPLTHNGKVQHQILKQQFLAGSIGRIEPGP